MEKKTVSRGMALVIAWIGCGLVLPSYIGDKEMARQRKRKLMKWLPWCVIGIGFVVILLYLASWILMDMLNCALGTLKYSDGTRVWR